MNDKKQKKENDRGVDIYTHIKHIAIFGDSVLLTQIFNIPFWLTIRPMLRYINQVILLRAHYSVH